ncbi:MAG: porphobilinogen deaminase [Candidatus Nitrosocaldaceae archaeon]|nr:MAG: porphobilinogen deaminase [Candidatus Nitrosocaldaceae archaeon]
MIRVGTRGSKLSLTQTRLILDAFNDLEFEIKIIKTKGDNDARPLYAINSKGIFEKEIDLALLNNEIDIAVHSMKDIPSELPKGLTIASVPKREVPNDVLVSRNKRLDELEPNSIIGTSSLRRAVQLKHIRDDLIIKDIRGNVETRINKMLNNQYDAVILAEAGLRRLGLEDYITQRFDPDLFLPAPCQGTLAIVAREKDEELIKTLKKIEDINSRLESVAERSLLAKMNAGCKFPLGAFAKVYDNKIRLHASICSYDASKRIDVTITDEKSNAEKVGVKVSEELISKGALELAKEWRYG